MVSRRKRFPEHRRPLSVRQKHTDVHRRSGISGQSGYGEINYHPRPGTGNFYGQAINRKPVGCHRNRLFRQREFGRLIQEPGDRILVADHVDVTERRAARNVRFDLDCDRGGVADRYVFQKRIGKRAAPLHEDALVTRIDHVHVADRDTVRGIKVGPQPDCPEIALPWVSFEVVASAAVQCHSVNGSRFKRIGIEFAAHGQTGIRECVGSNAILDAVALAAIDRKARSPPGQLYRTIANYIISAGMGPEVGCGPDGETVVTGAACSAVFYDAIEAAVAQIDSIRAGIAEAAIPYEQVRRFLVPAHPVTALHVFHPHAFDNGVPVGRVYPCFTALGPNAAPAPQ